MRTSSNSPATKVPLSLLRKYDCPGPRYTSYPTAPVWTEATQSEDYQQVLKAAAKRPEDLLAIYCHIPFCRRRCYYCGCNTCVTNNQSTVDDYIAAMTTEVNAVADLLQPRRKVIQLHFGGGTPTFIGVEGLDAILNVLEDRFVFTAGCERSIEVDPRVTTREQLGFLAGRGFDRVSIGVQDFDLNVQMASGRVQSHAKVETILNICRQLGFKGINFDLIYGLPLQTVGSFTETLEKTIHLGPDRLAVYSFAYLPDLKAHQSKIRPEELPTTEVRYQLFATAVEELTAAGYRQIGMDHFALPDDELAIAQTDGRLHRNFMGYTVQTAPEMVGFGMSAISYVGRSFFQNISKLDDYKKAIINRRFAVYRGMHLSMDDLIRQYVITSLMCNFRLDYDNFRHKFGETFAEYFFDERRALSRFFEDGLLKETVRELQITELGRTFVRNIAMTFDVYLKRDQPGKKMTFSRTV